MGGSYRHILNADGSFCGIDKIDNLGDAFEALEECYDMIEYLVRRGDEPELHPLVVKQIIAEAWAYGHLARRRPDFSAEKIAAAAERYWWE